MRRIFISLLAAVTLFTFTACGQTAILISRTKQDKKWTLGEIPKPDGWDHRAAAEHATTVLRS